MALLASLLPPIALDMLAGASAFAFAGSLFVYRKLQANREKGREAEIRFDQVLGQLAEGFYRTSPDGKLLYGNPAFVRIAGFSTLAELQKYVSENPDGFYVAPGRRKEILDTIGKFGEIRNFVSEIIVPGNGERLWVQENARAVCDKVSGDLLYYEGTVHETTSVVERLKSEERLRKLTQDLPGGLFQLERRSKGNYTVVFASQGFCNMLDRRFSPDAFDIEHFISLIHPQDLSGYNNALEQSLKSQRLWEHEFRIVTDAGKTKWLNVHAMPEQTEAGGTIWHGYLEDITLQKADQAQFRQLAYNDPLTKLPNRRFLVDRLSEALAAVGRRHEQSALLFIDLDNFKSLNDSYGHEAGDRLLVEVANRLKHVVRRNDTVARLSGDEFVILLDGLSNDANLSTNRAMLVAEKTINQLRRPFDVGVHSAYETSASIGVILFDENSKSVDELLRRADVAMYDVKRSGRNNVKLFQPDNNTTSAFDKTIAGSIAGALSNNEFELRYQPQVGQDGQIVGAEALLRWNHPEIGVLSPDRFMAIADQSGLSSKLNSFVVAKAVEVLGKWSKSTRGAELTLSINLGGEQFLRHDFARELRQQLKAAAIRNGALVLELTEEMLGNKRADAASILAQLKTTGVWISLDDFGSGSTSLASLKDLPVDEIKIDGRFVKGMATDKRDMAIVKSILALADSLGIASVAEHVESQCQEDLLIKEGCKRFQGFLYGGAMSLSDFEDVASLSDVHKRRAA